MLIKNIEYLKARTRISKFWTEIPGYLKKIIIPKIPGFSNFQILDFSGFVRRYWKNEPKKAMVEIKHDLASEMDHQLGNKYDMPEDERMLLTSAYENIVHKRYVQVNLKLPKTWKWYERRKKLLIFLLKNLSYRQYFYFFNVNLIFRNFILLKLIDLMCNWVTFWQIKRFKCGKFRGQAPLWLAETDLRGWTAH